MRVLLHTSGSLRGAPALAFSELKALRNQARQNGSAFPISLSLNLGLWQSPGPFFNCFQLACGFLIATELFARHLRIAAFYSKGECSSGRLRAYPAFHAQRHSQERWPSGRRRWTRNPLCSLCIGGSNPSLSAVFVRSLSAPKAPQKQLGTVIESLSTAFHICERLRIAQATGEQPRLSADHLAVQKSCFHQMAGDSGSSFVMKVLS